MPQLDEDDLEIMEEIPQSVLKEYFRLQSRFDFIKQSIRASLEKGATVEKGDCIAKLSKSTRRSPAWKQVVTQMLGKEKVDEIIAETPAKEVTSLKVDIKRQAMIDRSDLT